MKKFKIYLLLAAVFLTDCPRAQALELYFEKDDSLPLVHVSAAFRGGATQDPDGKSGVTDIMGNLMLRGTKNKTKAQIDLELDQMGASLEFEPRAEFIVFRGAVLSENLNVFLNLLTEILVSPSFRAQDLEKLKKEFSSNLLNELAQDSSLMKLRYDETFFKGHPYSKPNAGKIKDVQNLSVSDLEKQYQKLINQDQAIILGAGDARKSDFDSIVDSLKNKRNGSSNIAPIPAFAHHPKKLRVVIFDKPDRTQTQVMIGQAGISIHDPEIDALEIANHAFGGASFQARLMTELRVKRGWTYGAGSNFKLGSVPHSWKLAFFPKNADTPPAVKVAMQMVKDLKAKGITEAEFNASQKSMINSAGFNYNTPRKRLENRMTEIIYHLPFDYHKDWANRLSKLSLKEVNAAIEKFLTPEQTMIGLVATAKITKPGLAKALAIPENEIEVIDYQKE